MSLLALGSTIIFVAVALFISLWKKLGLEKDLLIGTVRSAIQLFLIGYVLHFIFNSSHFLLLFFIVMLMTVVAAWNAGKRGARLPGVYWRVFISIFSTEVLTIGLLLMLGIIPATSQYIIPISGMTIGNAMVVASLFLNQMHREMEAGKPEVETLLTLGASPKQAIHALLKRAVKASMIPTIDGMKTIGIVQLPGMMTGMIVAGASPLEAVRYQILITFAFASSAALTSMMLALLSYRLWFNGQDALRSHIDHQKRMVHSP